MSTLDFVPSFNTMKAFFSTALLVLFAVAVANAADEDTTFKDRLAEFRSGNHGVDEVRVMCDALKKCERKICIAFCL
jgi:hypothetical protein